MIQSGTTDAMLVVGTDCERVLVHSIGLGGFYYAAGAFEALPDPSAGQTGLLQVQWSELHQPRFKPTGEFQKPLTPWAPRGSAQ
jgi:hypothetical protein